LQEVYIIMILWFAIHLQPGGIHQLQQYSDLLLSMLLRIWRHQLPW